MQNKKNLIIIFFVSIISIISLNIGAEVIERILAVVNEDVILLSEWQEEVEFQKIKFRVMGKEIPPGQDKSFKKQILDNMINDLLLAQQADKMKISVENEEIEKQILDTASYSHLTKDQFEQSIKNVGMKLSQYKEDLRKELLRVKLLQGKYQGQIGVSDQEVKSYYRQIVRKLRASDRFKLKFFIIKQGMQKEQQQEELAEKIFDLWNSGVNTNKILKSFNNNKNISIGSTDFISKEDIDKRLYEVIIDLDPGMTGGPVKTKEGFYIIKLEEWYSSQAESFDKVKFKLKMDLLQDLMEQRLSSWLAQLRKEAYIEINE